MSSPSAPLTTVYATDEDVAVRAGGDYTLMTPKWQRLAHGRDGVFTAGASPTWVLSSASATFTSSTMGRGSVLWINGNNSSFRGSGELFGVDSVTNTTITLHRVGLAAGEGLPPGPAAGLSALEYTVLTLRPQIEEATFWLNQQYKIDGDWPGRRPADLFDLRDLRDACVLTVVARRIMSEVQDKPTGAWSLKLQHYREELGLIQDRLQLRWALDEGGRPNTNWFSTRIVR